MWNRDDRSGGFPLFSTSAPTGPTDIGGVVNRVKLIPAPPEVSPFSVQVDISISFLLAPFGHMFRESNSQTIRSADFYDAAIYKAL